MNWGTKLKTLILLSLLFIFCVDCSQAQASHAAEVLLISKVKNHQYTFFSVDSTGVVLGWNKNPTRLAQLSDMQVAAYDQETDIFVFSKDKIISVIPKFFESLVAESSINALSKEVGSRVMSLAISEDNSVIAGAFDATIYRWRFAKEDSAKTKNEKEKLIERYIGPAEPISALLQHPIGHVFFAADWDGIISGFKPYDADRLKGEYQFNQAISPYFTSTASRVRGGRAMYSTNTALNTLGATVQKSRIEKLVLIPPEGQEIISATSEGTIEIWKVRGMKVVGVLPGAHDGSLYGLAATSKYVASSGRDGTVRIFQIIRLTESQIKSQLERTVTHRLELVKELPLSDVKTLMFLDDHKIVAGKKDGQVLLVEW